ncbi:MAG: SBBP repeat-containing protein [bacterium]|nr:SBBP repeat-containing protein [bacterium]
MSSYLGGKFDDRAQTIALDEVGNIYVGGWTFSADWISGGYNTTYHPNGTNYEAMDGFVAKLSNDGTFLWSTYIGGYSTDYCFGITVDQSGDVYAVGGTYSSD